MRLGTLWRWRINGRTQNGTDANVLAWIFTADAARRLERVLTNDPGTGVMRHADAGYESAIECAKEQGLNLPMIG